MIPENTLIVTSLMNGESRLSIPMVKNSYCGYQKEELYFRQKAEKLAIVTMSALELNDYWNGN